MGHCSSIVLWRRLPATAGKLSFPAYLHYNRREADGHPKGRSEAKEARSALTVRGTEVRSLRDSEVIGESIEWRAKAMTFPWPVVQGVGDRVAPVLGEPLHGRAFRDVLPNEAVRVLVRASFPRRVRRGEVDRYAGSSLDVFVAVELRTVVDGDGLEQTRMCLNQLDDALVDGGGSAAP